METFNDWGYCGQDCRADANGQPNNGCTNPYGSYVCTEYCPGCAFNGSDMFSGLSPDGTNTLYFWYYRGTPWGPVSMKPSLHFPDVILGNALDAATLGNPGFGVADHCIDSSPLYGHFRGLGFYNDPVPNGRYPQGGTFIDGTWETWFSDAGEARGNSPRFARDPYGYLQPISDYPKRWSTYVYYDDSQIHRSATCNSHYDNYSGAHLAVSLVEITEQ